VLCLEYNNFFSTETAGKKQLINYLSVRWPASGQQQAMQQQFRRNTTIPISTNQLQYDAFATNNN
jgi:hypothetical protein